LGASFRRAANQKRENAANFGNTVGFYLSPTRGIAAAKAFFRKAFKKHAEPHSITLDGHQPSHCALRRMGMNGEFNFRGPDPVKIRSCPYLNNIVEQDHRRVKCRLQPMLGFKSFYHARRVIIGIELGAEDSQTVANDTSGTGRQSAFPVWTAETLH
jgi:transposase-like protein